MARIFVDSELFADEVKLYYEDESYIYTNPLIGVINLEAVKNKELDRGIYAIYDNGKLLGHCYQEELEWYSIDNTSTLHFIGYTTDEFIRENIARRLNHL